MTIWQTHFREIILQQKALSYNLEIERIRKENLEYIQLTSKLMTAMRNRETSEGKSGIYIHLDDGHWKHWP